MEAEDSTVTKLVSPPGPNKALSGAVFLEVVFTLFAFASSSWASDLNKTNHANGDRRSESGASQERYDVDVQTFGDNRVAIYRAPECEMDCLDIYKKGGLVHSQSGGRFRVGCVDAEDKRTPSVRMGADITGGGEPNLVVSSWSGGAHCCYTFYVFGIGKEFHEIAELEAKHSSTSCFEDLTGDARLEFVTNDWTFAYWRASFAESPAPDVVLRFEKGEYHLAADLMAKRPPTSDELSTLAERVRNSEGNVPDWPSPLLWATMLNLIYTGHADMAWKFYDQAWPPRLNNKKKFLEDFRIQLETSPYWSELKAIVEQ
jgi:hypothetical protein